MKTAVIYARYSSERQTEQSIEGQLRVCQDYAKRNDIIILDSYIDRAMTGKNDNRASFQKMLKDSNKSNWDYVLVYKLDRFSRNKYEMAIHKKTLKDNGVKLLSAMENIPDTPEGIILESLLEGMAEYYSAELAQKVNRGIKESWLKGLATGGGHAYGYDIVNKKYVINPQEAEVVKEVFTKYSQGYNANTIAKSLNKRHLLRSDGKPFDNKYLYILLHQKHFTGKVLRQGEEYDNIYPQIISEELWQKVCMINEENKLSPSRKKETFEYILTGKLVCGECKHKMVGDSGTSRTNKVFYYYVCPSKRRKREKCNSKSFNKKDLEDLVISTTTELLNNDQNIDYIAQKVFELHKNKANNNPALKTLLKKCDELLKASKNILNAIEQGIITDLTKSRLTELENEIYQIEFDIDKEKQKTYQFLTKEDIKEFLKSKVFNSTDDISIRKLIVNTFIKEIILYSDKIIITYRFTNPIEYDKITPETTKAIEQESKSALNIVSSDNSQNFQPV